MLGSSQQCPSQTCKTTIAGTEFTLTCSVDSDLPDTDVLEWLFAGSTDSTLPDDIDILATSSTVINDNVNANVYTIANTLQFPPLRLYHAGEYTCRVRSNDESMAANISIRVNGTAMYSYVFILLYMLWRLKLILTVPVHVHLSHSPLPPDLTTEGECTTFTCTVELGPGLVDSDLSLIEVDAQLYRDGAPLVLSGPTVVTDTTLTYSTQLDLSVRNYYESYTCTATVRPRDESPYIDTISQSDVVAISSTGKSKFSSDTYSITVNMALHYYRFVYQPSWQNLC